MLSDKLKCISICFFFEYLVHIYTVKTRDIIEIGYKLIMNILRIFLHYKEQES